MAPHRPANLRLDQQRRVLDAGAVLVHAFNGLRDELVSTLLFVLGNKEDAQDAAQDAFLKCWGARDQTGQIQNLRAWIFRICFKHRQGPARSAWKRRVKPPAGGEFMVAHNEPPAPGKCWNTGNRSSACGRPSWDCARRKGNLPLGQNGELTYEQIAEMRQVPVGTVKTQIAQRPRKTPQDLGLSRLRLRARLLSRKRLGNLP